MADMIKVIKIGDTSYELNGKYIQDTAGNAKSWEDILALANSSKLELKVVTSLPTASADTMSNIYLVAEEGTVSGTYVEYVTIRSGSAAPYTYSWERIGTTAADIAGKANKGTYDSTSVGDHAHTVSGSVTVPTVSNTSKHLTASASGTAVAGNGTAKAITALGTPNTDEVLGAGTTFGVTGGTASKTNIKATASGTAVGANGTVSAITALGTPTTADAITGFGDHDTNEVLGAGTTFSVTGGTASKTNIKATASGTALSTSSADFVKSYPGATSKLATTTIKGVSGTTTVPGSVSVTAGSAASWSASVAADGTLSFSFSANTPTAVSVGANKTVATANSSATTVATGSLAADGAGGTVMTGLGTATTAKALTSASVSAQPTIALSTGATSGAGVVEVVTGVSAVGVSANADDKVTAITGLGTPTTAAAITGFGAHTTKSVLTGVKVTAQPTIALSTGATTGTGVVEVVTGVSAVSVSANTNDKVNAITGFGAHTTADVLTGVKVTSQPTITLADTASTGGVEFVSAVTVGSTSASLSGGSTNTTGAHTHKTTI